MEAPARTISERVKRLRREYPTVTTPKKPRQLRPPVKLPDGQDIDWDDETVLVSARNHSAEIGYEYMRYKHDWSRFVFDGFDGTDVHTSVTGDGENIDLCARKERVTLNIDDIEIHAHPRGNHGHVQVELDFASNTLRVYKKMTGVDGLVIAALVPVDPDRGLSAYSRPEPLKY